LRERTTGDILGQGGDIAQRPIKDIFKGITKGEQAIFDGMQLFGAGERQLSG
jgi:hypothetical protein